MGKFLTLGGAEVSFHHEFDAKPVLNSKKGLTEVVFYPKATNVTIKTENETVSARVSCSHKDSFKYETGRKLALARAFKQTKTMSKEDKRFVWEEYNKLKPGGRW